jgi:hypothetical protein
MSSDARDKILAALSWPIGKWKHRTDPDYTRAPMYFDACWDWYQGLSADDKETCLTLADAVASAHKDAAESMAESLPPAPRCPL